MMQTTTTAGAFPPAHSRHVANIQGLCNEMDRPFDEMAAAYESELARLMAVAAIEDYLPVLAEKHIRAVYRQRRERIEDGQTGAMPAPAQ